MHDQVIHNEFIPTFIVVRSGPKDPEGSPTRTRKNNVEELNKSLSWLLKSGIYQDLEQVNIVKANKKKSPCFDE